MAAGRLARGLAGAALLLPAVLASLTAAHLIRHAWPAAAARGEPVVTALIGPREPGAALAAAAAGASLDASYPRDLSGRVRAEGRSAEWPEPSVDAAWRWTLETARRSPTDAESRFHLSGLAWRRGDSGEADRQARAALRLAPLYRNLRRRVALWFASRYDRTRDRAHLTAAISASGGGAEAYVAGLLGDPRLTREEIRAAFASAHVSPRAQLGYLEAAGRWDGAIEVAREADRAAGTGSGLEAGVRFRLSGYLFRTDRAAAAFRQVRRAAELSRETVTDHLLLGRAYLADGSRRPAGEAFRKFLDGGGEAGEVEQALEADGTSAALRQFVWTGIVESGRGGDRARLARARAFAAERDLATAHRLLVELIDRPSVGPEACYELARAHREFGDRRVALRYARRAVEREPRNERYARMLRALERGSGK